MGIERDIRQTRFRNEYQKAAINLSLYLRFTDQRSGNFASEDITSAAVQYSARPAVLLETPVYPPDRERMLDKMSDTSRLVDRLLATKGPGEKGALMRADRRSVDVTIADKCKNCRMTTGQSGGKRS